MAALTIKIGLWYQSQELYQWLHTLSERTKRLSLVCVAGNADDLERCLEDQTLDVLVVEYDAAREDLNFQLERFLLRRPEVHLLVVASSTDPDSLLKAMRLGAREYLVKPVSDSEFASALVRVARLMEASRRRQVRAGRTVALIGAKGGLGVTSLAVNLAAELAEMGGGRVGLFDLNLINPDVGLSLDLDPGHTLANLARAEGRLDELAIEEATVDFEGRFTVLCGPADFVEAAAVGPDDVEKLLLVATDSYDWLILDVAPGTDDRTIKALDKAHVVLFVTQATVSGLKNAQRSLSLFSRLGYGPEKIKIIIDRSGRRGDLSASQIKRVLSEEIYFTLPDDESAMLAAEGAGKPLHRVRRRSPLRKACAKLAARLSQEVVVAKESGEPNPGLEPSDNLRVVS
ncbi:MAG: AAA family ATPase [Proteobacteria bacterium]|nr:AAA family ATPase [Pseudomonadota bacterium]MBU1740171.1 AAA family ATPase [Pseudomonadota bacterium]